MRSIDQIVEEVIEIINTVPMMTAMSSYSNVPMDTPVDTPVIAVGVDSAVLKADKMSTYSGIKANGAEGYSMPVTLTLSLDMFLPHTAMGVANYQAMCDILFALMESDKVISEVTCEKMYYAPSYISTILPVKVTLNDRVCNDWSKEF